MSIFLKRVLKSEDILNEDREDKSNIKNQRHGVSTVGISRHFPTTYMNIFRVSHTLVRSIEFST